mgnify:CR=1 FL=1
MELSMPKPRPQYLQRHKTRHGKFNWYVQIADGPLVRVNPGFGEPGFADAYESALQKAKAAKPAISAPKAAKGTLEWAWQSYIRSGSWSALKPATRKQRDNIMKHVLETAGSEPLSAIDRVAINDGIERRSATPSAARNFLDTMRGMFTWLLEQRIARTDPTAGIKVKRPKTEGFLPWSYDEIIRFEKRWPIGTRERVMLDVLLYTGLRRGDAAIVGKQHLKDGVISIKRKKPASGFMSRFSTCCEGLLMLVLPATSLLSRPRRASQ